MEIGIDSPDRPIYVLPGQWEHDQNILCKAIFLFKNEYLTDALNYSLDHKNWNFIGD